MGQCSSATIATNASDFTSDKYLPSQAPSSSEDAPAVQAAPSQDLTPPPASSKATPSSPGGARPLTLFACTFNINGSPITAADVDAWLVSHGSTSCDLICLSFQECGTCSNGGLPFPPGSCAGVSASTLSDYVRLGGEEQRSVNEHGDAEFVKAILGTLNENKGGREYKVVADVSIGEPPTSSKVDVMGKMTEWYGFIRTIVLADGRADLGPGKEEDWKVRTMVCPVGEKLSMFSPHKYAAAPDKGAVAVHIPPLDLLLVSLHLSGTNKYGVPERKFDEERRGQLRMISECLEEGVGGERYSKARKVVMGDFNFRCEMRPGEADKGKGGNDWNAVNDEVTSADAGRLEKAFFGFDRLQRWLVKRGVWERTELSNPEAKGDDGAEDEFGPTDEATPSILLNTLDAITLAPSLPVPTFTFKIGEPPPRNYSNKRTPSWTDRIVVGQGVEVEGVGVERT
eukprot:CAMPEP_0182458060 /NCGR_PEP_ID=MMETSP1319-20130603/3490_1 /TAXON_ID=172717 /ORGANISM="Bolidomonas pacifica, Strain RCC208" /LENGTH=455 /DNA_ID=CAMNT_0024656669 /DNA_START=147 /DNA_END=1511 /DNA_ORIENTATION=-